MFNRIRYIVLTFGMLFITADIAFAAQYARPSGTVSAGNWTASGASTLHEATDETAPNDETDYMTSGNRITTAELSLSPVTDPQTNTGHIIRFAIRDTRLHARPRHPHRKAARMMVAAIGLFGQLALRIVRSSEFSSPNDQSIFKQSSLL